MARGRTVATLTPTDTGLRLLSHSREWAKSRWSKRQTNGVDADFTVEAVTDH